MREDELLTLVARGEGGELEFKSGDVAPGKLAREVVAFANLRGGRILLGVEDDGKLTGWRKDKTEEWLMDSVIAENVHPRIIPDYEELVVKGKRIGVVAVPQGTVKPYAVQKRGGGDKIFIRIGSVCREASREQIMRMMDSAGGFYEKLPVHGSDYRRELHSELVENYFRDIDEAECKDEAELEALMHNRDFLVAPEFREELLCSVFSYILFARAPLRRLPQAGIRILAFRGAEMETDALLDEQLDAPFLGHNPAIATLPSIPDLVASYLRQYISREKVHSDMRRHRTWDYPEEALRELVVNAFAHRDWTRADQIRIIAFADRLVVESPGALPNGMTPEKIKSGTRVMRNPAIVQMLRDYRFAENRGMGIRRKVIPLMREHNNCEPEFVAAEDYFRVILPKRKE